MSAKKIVKRASGVMATADIFPAESAVIKETIPPAEVPVIEYVSGIPNISELYTMKFVTDKGEFVGIRRGLKLGSIEIYPVK